MTIKKIRALHRFLIGALLSLNMSCGSLNVEVGAFDSAIQDVDEDALMSVPHEECGNGMDDDADGQLDEGCPCGRGETQDCFTGGYPTRRIGACRDGSQSCDAPTEFGFWGMCTGDTLPSPEACDGAIDDDCDGAVDEGCPCTTGQTSPCGTEFVVAPCTAGVQTCRPDGTWTGCEGAVGPSAEACGPTGTGDGIDNDCDGERDEGCGCVPSPEVCGDGIDNDCDGDTDEFCCHPEICGDSVDNDCDGEVDEGDCEGACTVAPRCEGAPSPVAPWARSYGSTQLSDRVGTTYRFVPPLVDCEGTLYLSMFNGPAEPFEATPLHSSSGSMFVALEPDGGGRRIWSESAPDFAEIHEGLIYLAWTRTPGALDPDIDVGGEMVRLIRTEPFARQVTLLASYTLDGTLRWHRQYAHTALKQLIIGEQGAYLIAAPSPFDHEGAPGDGRHDIFMHIDHCGETQWRRPIFEGAQTLVHTSAYREGALYMGGGFTGEMTVGGTTHRATERQPFVMRLDEEGVPQWLRVFSVDGRSGFPYRVLPHGGTIYLAGSVGETTTMTLERETVSAGNHGGTVIASLQATDGSPQWLRGVGDGTTGFFHYEGYRSLLVDGDELLLGGRFQSTFRWGPGFEQTAAQEGTRPTLDGFIARYGTATGDLRGVERFGTVNDDTILGLVRTPSGPLVVGEFLGRLEVDGHAPLMGRSSTPRSEDREYTDDIFLLQR